MEDGGKTGTALSHRGGSRRFRRGGRLALAAIVAALFVLASSAAVATAATPGDHRWFDTVSGPSRHDMAVAVATNAAGQPIVVGDYSSPSGNRDICYRSYTLGGSMRWTAVATTWDGGVGLPDTAAGLVVDKARNCVYVAGTTESADGDTDYVILRVRDADSPGGSPGGALLWARTFDASPGGDEGAAAIARDKYGNVYVTGSSQRSDGSWDLHVVKYKRDGTRAWAKRHNSGGTNVDSGRAIAVRGSSVFVAGVSERPGHGEDIVIIKYALGGSKKWVRYYDDSLHRSEEVTAIAATSSSVYLCGRGKYTSSKPGDALLLKYGHDGSRKWVRWTVGSGGSHDAWADLAVDNKAKVHVTGWCTRTGSGPDIVTRLYSTSGTRLWQRILKTGGSDVGTALAVDSSRRTYVCGYRTLGGDADALVIKYGTGGATLWKSIYPDPAHYPGETDIGIDQAYDVAVRGDNVYAVGRQPIDYGGTVVSDFLTLAIWR